MLPCKSFGSPVLRSRARMQARPACLPTRQVSAAGRARHLVPPGSRSAPVLRATGTDGTTSTAPSSSSSSSSTDERIKTTMADLDALLGIQEEPAPSEAKVGLCT